MSEKLNKSLLHQSSYPELYNFFCRNLANSFQDLSLTNRDVLEYIASLLANFARTENLFRIKQIPAYKLETVVETLILLETPKRGDHVIAENEEILIRKQVGDFTLFMTGIFREYIQRIGVLEFYHYEGTRSYHHVYDFAAPAYGSRAEIFADLSKGFEIYSSALDYMSKVYFHHSRVDEAVQHLLRHLFA